MTIIKKTVQEIGCGTFVWLATGRACFPCHSPHRKRIAQHGLEFCAHHLDLDHYLDPDH